MCELIVRVGERTFRLGPDDTFTFGRAPECSVCLDPDDAAISRQAGEIQAVNGTWLAVNVSRTRHFEVVDECGLRAVVRPGTPHVLQGSMRVLVQRTNGKPHVLHVDAPTLQIRSSDKVPEGLATAVGQDVSINHEDRLALVALFAGFLEDGERHDEHPRTYAAAAHRLGWPRTTLVKRIEYLRTRLDKAGVPNMMGAYALYDLAKYVLSRGLITKADLPLLNMGRASDSV